MSYASVRQISATRIPVIDIATLFDASPDYARVGGELEAAAEGSGFFYVRNHNIEQGLIESTFDVASRFFAASDEAKQQVTIDRYHRGLLSIGQAKMEGQPRSDLKESFLWGIDVEPGNPDFEAGNVMLPPNRWPAFLPEMPDVLNRYMASAHRCGKQLLRAIAVSLGVGQDYFVSHFNKPISRGSLIHYPPQPPELGDDQYGVSPHTDYGTMTLLVQDDTGGLRVRDRSGDWITAHPIKDTLVVNVGDLLARWSNNRFRSTEHAVINSAGRQRYSIAIALDPNWETPIRPVVRGGESPLFEEVCCGEYIQGRFDRSFRYRQQQNH